MEPVSDIRRFVAEAAPRSGTAQLQIAILHNPSKATVNAKCKSLAALQQPDVAEG